MATPYALVSFERTTSTQDLSPDNSSGPPRCWWWRRSRRHRQRTVGGRLAERARGRWLPRWRSAVLGRPRPGRG